MEARKKLVLSMIILTYLYQSMKTELISWRDIIKSSGENPDGLLPMSDTSIPKDITFCRFGID